jgi:hypothetical protein
MTFGSHQKVLVPLATDLEVSGWVQKHVFLLRRFVLSSSKTPARGAYSQLLPAPKSARG